MATIALDLALVPRTDFRRRLISRGHPCTVPPFWKLATRFPPRTFSPATSIPLVKLSQLSLLLLRRPSQVQGISESLRRGQYLLLPLQQESLDKDVPLQHALENSVNIRSVAIALFKESLKLLCVVIHTFSRLLPPPQHLC